MVNSSGTSHWYIATNVARSVQRDYQAGKYLSAAFKGLCAVVTSPLWGVVGGAVEGGARLCNALSNRRVHPAPTEFVHRDSKLSLSDGYAVRLHLTPKLDKSVFFAQVASSHETKRTQVNLTGVDVDLKPFVDTSRTDTPLDQLLSDQPENPKMSLAGFQKFMEERQCVENLHFLCAMREFNSTPTLERIAEIYNQHCASGLVNVGGTEMTDLTTAIQAMQAMGTEGGDTYALAKDLVDKLRRVEKDIRLMVENDSLRPYLLSLR